MPRRKSVAIELSEREKMVLGRMNKDAFLPRRDIIRVSIIWRAAHGQTNYMIAKELRISRNTVKKWRHRFARERLAGLETRPIPGRPKKNLGA